MDCKFPFSKFFNLVVFLFSFIANSQTPESCDCTPDISGLSNYLNSLTLNENAPLRFDVPSNTSTYAVLHGVIGSTTPAVTQTFIDNYPNVTTLVFMQIPGSEDDTANLQASQKLKDRGYTTYLPAVNAYNQDAFIASGGTDMFFAGNKRIIDPGAEVGVHSWSDGTNEATDYPVGHDNHQPYINYYVAMGLSQADSEAFYYYTINAAPANNIHNMTEAEIEQYKLRTCKYTSNPTYTITNNNNTLSSNLTGASYQWVDCNNGNAPISGATNQNFTPTSNGSYAVQITENGCNGISNCIQINSLSVSQHELNNLIKLYPNPTESDNVYLDCSRLNEEVYISIKDINGKHIKTINSLGAEILTINTQRYARGIYFLTLQSESLYKNIKMLVK
ncbi:T9SS type A sorting domain-containing protein [Pseudofulvibacter geojedonensis]|uniref:T9SS type A sorting domain-containing protein n=1 Tax=Pseudofulvibacter geojedonensis TaxID=1123758 RepID=A0ABW3I3U1_9FLAO